MEDTQDMDELETSLSRALGALVDGERPSPELRERVADDVTAPPAAARPRFLPAAAAAAVLVFALLAAVVAAGSDDDDTAVATDPTPPTTEAPQVLGDSITRTPTAEAITPTTVTTAPPTTLPPTTTTAAVAPATTAPPPPPPAPAPTPAPEPQRTTGSITVEVSTTEGASRYVSLRTTGGATIADRVPVTGEPIVFGDLQPGDYFVDLEQVSDDGGTTTSRTAVSIQAGEDAVVSCSSDTLDCSR